MALGNTRGAWGLVARLFHWSMAILIIAMLILGTVMVAWPNEDLATKFELYQWHKSFGILLFGLLTLRLVWRLVQPVPDLPPGTSRFTQRAAAISHATLYGLMIALPITGYLMSAASPLGIPTVAFGVLPIPHLVPTSEATEALFKSVHYWLGNLLILVLAVHVLAAIKHAVIDRDGIWSRMVRGQASS